MGETNILLAAVSVIIAALGGYLLGSINCAILICRAFYGKDVRSLGSGNAGMTNVARNFGKRDAGLTLIGDIAKGVLAVLLGHFAVSLLQSGLSPICGKYIAGIFAILGHMWPIFFSFKGGKGVATSGGVILAIQPLLFLALVSIFLVVFAKGKMVSLASIIGISLYPLVTFLWCYFNLEPMIIFSVICSFVLSGLVVYMHRENIKRILNGTEYKFLKK